jgi:hypothetical protein
MQPEPRTSCYVDKATEREITNAEMRRNIMKKLLIATAMTALLAGTGLASAQTHAQGNMQPGQASGQDQTHNQAPAQSRSTGESQ